MDLGLGELEKVINQVKAGPSRPERPQWAFNPDKLDSEMNQVPLFMKNLPADEEENVALQALQTLKFDGSPEENALNFKELGNEAFQGGKAGYKDAIEYYTQALDQNSSDTKLNVICYINRAAVNLELGNYRRVLSDCSKALGLDPKNIKALYRSSRALFLLEKAKEAIDCCQFGLNIDPENASLKSILDKSIALKNKMDEKERILKEKEALEAQNAIELEQALKARNIRMLDSNDKMYIPDSKATHKVEYDSKNDQLLWPTFFLYPEPKDSDFIQSCSDLTTFQDHIEMMFAQPAPWDDQSNPKYTPETIEVYFESYPTNAVRATLVKIGKKNLLRDVLKHPKYFVVNGTPSFIILSKDSKFKEEFLDRYRQ